MLKCTCAVQAKVRPETPRVMVAVPGGQTTKTGLVDLHPMTAVRYCQTPEVAKLKRNSLAAGTLPFSV